ncbi:hypothetical protein ACFL6X_00475 [Candidatus Latescibacterota bacterium]
MKGSAAPGRTPANRARRALRALTVTSLTVTALLACSQNQSDKPVDEALAESGLTAVPKAGSPSAGHPPVGHPPVATSLGEGRVAVGQLSAVLPEGWRPVPPSSSMRAAEFVLPGSSGVGDANLAVFVGNWGSAEDNVSRWVGQFSQPDGSSSVEAAQRRAIVVGQGEEGGDLPVTRVDVTGTFSGAMGAGAGAATPDSRMLGAIVQTGATFHYLKLVGPEPTVGRWQASFDTFVASMRQI